MSTPIKPVHRYKDFVSHYPPARRLRDRVRDGAVFALSLGSSLGRTSDWIAFPYYHHVFEDERRGFARQLDYMRRFGEFIGLDDAVDLLESGDPVDGRYFCVTFDDGFKNCLTNAMPIMVARGAPGAFFLATRYIGTDSETDRDLLLRFFDSGRTLVEFLGWEDCRRMADAGMTIGSHTISHARLATLSDGDAESEMVQSKQTIEAELGRPCIHFCSPFGQPDADFLPGRDPDLARRAGYRSFLMTQRGVMRQGDSPMLIRRDHVLANWGSHQLRYFLSR